MLDLLTVAIAGLIGVGGTALGQWLQTKARSSERTEDLRRLTWEAKRESYVALCRAIDAVDSAASGAAVSGGGPVSKEVGLQLTDAAVVVELLVEQEVWAKIKPAIDAVVLRANSVAPVPKSAEAAERLREIGAHESEGWERLREQMFSAMRADLRAR